MRRRDFIALVGASAAAWPLAARAQQAANVPHVSFLLRVEARSDKALMDAFLQGLTDYGYVDGKNIIIDYFVAPTAVAVPEYAAKAVASKPALIVTYGPPAAVAAKALTTAIPIVFTGGGDPIALGLVTNYPRPGGNLTGSVNLVTDNKWPEILKEIIPNLARVAFLVQPSDPAAPLQISRNLRAAEALRLSAFHFEFEEGFDFEQLFVQATAMGVQAIFAPGNPYLTNNSAAFAKLSLQYRLPFVGQDRALPNAGGLASFGPSIFPLMRGLAYYIDAVLKGAKPGDLPVETAAPYELVVNVKTAKALGLTIPQSILLRASELVE